jgi:hypothetical protein
VSPSPFLWRQEGSYPDAALGGFRLVLLRAVIPATTVCQSPTPPHQPGVEVGTVRTEASRENAIVAIEAVGLARQVARADVAPELLRGCFAARPCLPPGIDAGLLPLGSVDPLQANACSGYFDAVAIEHPRLADQRRRRLRRPGSVSMKADQSEQQHDSDQRAGVAPAPPVPPCARSVCPRSHRSRCRFAPPLRPFESSRRLYASLRAPRPGVAPSRSVEPATIFCPILG